MATSKQKYRTSDTELDSEQITFIENIKDYYNYAMQLLKEPHDSLDKFLFMNEIKYGDKIDYYLLRNKYFKIDLELVFECIRDSNKMEFYELSHILKDLAERT